MIHSSKETKETKSCYHCGEQCSNKQIFLAEKYFCCNGCKMVFEILNQNELCTYYDLNLNPGLAQKFNVRADKFEYLDEPLIANKIIRFTEGAQSQVSFYLPQMHCSSCLYLLENLHKINNGILSSRVNFTQKETFIIFDNTQTSLRDIAETLTSIGYEPHISLQDVNKDQFKKSPNSKLYKIGISGFCFANIMMLSLPEYFSFGTVLEKEIGNAYKYFIVLLSLPVLFYCANEFFILAWKGLKNKFLNIDLPISIAILITFLRSLYELVSETGSGYLDSMSGIVFFMLVGRLVQDKTYKSISFDRDYKSFFPIAVRTLRDGNFIPISVEDLRVNDLIQIRNNEIIPVDGILSTGIASIDYSFVSGESLPTVKNIGELIYAGGKQINGNIELLVVKEISQSYLTNLWNKDVFKTEKKSDSVIHSLSKYFTSIVLLIGLVAAIYWYIKGENTLMWNALTTILIVACPCALLLSSTFTNGNILRILSENKFYLRHPDVIENLASIDHIVFDKTGTITQNKNSDIQFTGKSLSVDQKEMVAALLSHSSHPLSIMVLGYLDFNNVLTVDSFKVWPGQGIEGWVNEHHIKIGSADFVQYLEKGNRDNSNGSKIFIKIEKEVLGLFRVKNAYRSGFEAMINSLKGDYNLSVLSGDNNNEELYLQSIMGQNTQLLFDQKPEEKLAYISKLRIIEKSKVLMVGDGLNDAGALKQSNVGIALSEGVNNFTPACDGILDASQFSKLNQFILFAQKGQKIILASFVLSIVYNIIGLYFAVQGTLSPVIAAILMPTSSISIILITYGLSQFEGKRLGLH